MSRREVYYLRIVDPLLIPFATVARIEDDVAAAVIQARLVSPDLARLAEHPVLRQMISINAGSQRRTGLPATDHPDRRYRGEEA
jgi:hypothetical protein